MERGRKRAAFTITRCAVLSALAMALYATQVSASLYPDHGSVHLEYQLDVQGSFAAMHTLQLEYVAEEQPC